MHTQTRTVPYARLNAFHGPKRQVLGNHAGVVPPAWRVTPGMLPPGGKGKQAAQGVQESKIFLSRLPLDVSESEVEELFKKTVGPLKDSFIIYNSQGKSKGMAVVTFQRPGDALIARTKYDGKIVDGRRPIKIEIIVDGLSASGAPTTPLSRSLKDRLENPTRTFMPPGAVGGKIPTGPSQPTQPRNQIKQPNLRTVPPATKAPIPPRRVRAKKGPRRIQKQLAKSRDQLDKEMEDYRAAADAMVA